jgi:DNA-directed RNA polymerase subunit RPC12/RpoP
MSNTSDNKISDGSLPAYVHPGYIKRTPGDTAAPMAAQEALEQILRLRRGNAQLMTWIHDLQSGMYINCVYCGHRYGPKDKTPATMADMLKAHIEVCPSHPMSVLKRRIEAAEEWYRKEYAGEFSEGSDEVFPWDHA